MLGDHPFFIRWQNVNGDARIVRADPLRMRFVGRSVGIDPEPGQAGHGLPPHARRVLPDAACKDERIETAERGGQRRDLGDQAMHKIIDCAASGRCEASSSRMSLETPERPFRPLCL